MTKKSYLKSKEVKVLTIEGEKISVKKIAFGETRKAMTIATIVDNKTKTASVDSGLVAVLRTIYAITDWDLVGEDGEKLPIDLDTFDNVLDEEFVGSIIQEVNDFLGDEGLKDAEKN